MTLEKIDIRIILALVLYIVSLLASNTLGLKLMPFVFSTHLSVSVFFFPVVFLMTDVVGQVYGQKMAKNFVWAGFISIALFMFYSALSVFLPWSGEALWAKDSYEMIFGISFRISLASLLAFIIAEYQDVITFFFFKNKLSGYFWLSSNLSNLWSQLLDTLIFMFVAFIGVYSVKTIILLSLPWWFYKVVMGFLYTPLSYLGLKMLQYPKKKVYEN